MPFAANPTYNMVKGDSAENGIFMARLEDGKLACKLGDMTSTILPHR